MEGTQTSYDAIVVGSGPGGATVARELTKKGQTVLMLEWGDNKPVTGTITNMAPRGLLPFRSLLLTGQALGMVRGITTGGSSIFYCATAFDTPLEMLRKYGVDIEADVEAIRNELPCAPLSDDLVSPAGRVFEAHAAALGYDCKRLNKLIYQDKCKPDCQLCLYGCPHGAKWNARNFVNEAVEHGATLVNGAKVDRVITENDRAIGVVYRHAKQDKQAFAQNIIVAAGGIGSPLILRRTGISDVGKDFFYDPLIFVMGRVPGVGNGRGLCMSAGVHFPDDGIVMTDFNLPHLMKIMFDVEVFKFRQAFAYKDVVPIMIKIRDGLGGRVINDNLIWKGLSQADKQKLDLGAKHAGRILEHAGATKVHRSWYLAAHPGGTVKIGTHLDADLRTAIDHLYVCDCSVIPEQWGLPPTVTILGLGRRLARHLTAGLPATQSIEDMSSQLQSATAA